jgi:hypothetical protein
MTRLRPALLSLVLVAFAAGCGNSGGGGASPEDEACQDSWNGDDIALTVGLHAHDGHGIRRALVERVEAPDAPNVRTKSTCLVVFAAERGDKEFGTLGLVVTRFGWSQLFELGYSDAELDALQDSASVDANASVLPDGKLDLD